MTKHKQTIENQIQIQAEQQKEKNTKKLFKQLKRNYNILLLDKVKDIKQTLTIENYTALISDKNLFKYFLQSNATTIIDELIQQLKEQYYNDDNYYCNTELFYNLKLYYQLHYNKTIKPIIEALSNP